MYTYDRSFVAKAVPTEDLSKSLAALGSIVRILEEAAPGLQSPYAAKYTLESSFKDFAFIARGLARGLLQSYQAEPNDRKVLEQASATFTRSHIVLRRGKELEGYSKLVGEWRTFYNVAKRVLEAGVVHEEGAWKAGPFNLVNTGGFSDKAMQDVAKVVEKAAALLHRKGLGKVSYGDIHVTNTIRKSTRVLAFYDTSVDELFIRANLKGQQGPALTSVIHELAHRLHFKFLSSKTAEINRLFEVLSAQDQNQMSAVMGDKANWPQPGAEISEGRRNYVVIDVVYPDVRLYRKDNPNQKASIKLKNYLARGLLAKGESTFVTPYAKTVPKENFAEMVAFYCQDLLPDDQVNMLKAIL